MRILIAGVGNIFFGDDGFGPEVSRRIPVHELPDGVENVDYGIRGLHLAYDLLAETDSLVLVDAIPDRGEPGHLRSFRVDESDLVTAEFDPHGMNPLAVLSLLSPIGARLPPRTIVVGCQAQSIDEGIGLSPAVAAAVDDAVEFVLEEVSLCASASQGKSYR
ncbi:hydrogenase maturation protease [Rhodococcoides yunnanense]|uniref:hydrogenase maturation protease n=1 Tax=Rhodococcoides yunnanense TaxID=278209 RepID=UPI000932DAA6|nr:hydrogenase maturation protease [Rhodococcus yunnanensis]